MTSRKAVKGTRKRRLARLPSAILPEGGYPGPKFEPTAEDWQRMKEAYRHPHPLDVADQQEIGRLVSNYFDVQPYEPSAPFVEDDEKWLAKVDKAADGFYQALLFGEQLENEIERDAAFHAGLRIEKHLKNLKTLPLRSMEDYRDAMFAFLAAAAVARNKLKDVAGKGFAEGALGTISL
jgi:hypothetical protein